MTSCLPHVLQHTLGRHAPQRNQNGDRGRKQKHGEGKGGAEPQPRLHNEPNFLAGIAKDGGIWRAFRIGLPRRSNAASSGYSQRAGVHTAHEERDENGRDSDSNLQSNFVVLAAGFRDFFCGAFVKFGERD